jgi:hypothetical protein
MRASCHEFFDLIHAANAAARARCSAVQRGRGTGKVQLPLQWPSLQKGIDKTCVKNIAGAGCVHDWDLERVGVVKLPAIPR